MKKKSVYVAYNGDGGTVTAPPSKSCTHRLLICAALADKPTVIHSRALSGDISATISCLRALGADVRFDGERFAVSPINTPPDSCAFECGESGTTLRFMLPIAGALGVKGIFTGSDSLAGRPMEPLCTELLMHGVHLTSGKLPICCRGKLTKGDYVVDCSASSQFASGLLLALPLCGGGTITITGERRSRPYIDLTAGIMRDFGADVFGEDDVLGASGQKRLISSGEYTAEGDWSNSAYWLALGALCNSVEVKGLNIDTLQGDKYICDILSDFGAHLTVTSSGITVSPGCRLPFEADASMTPDLVPVMCVLGCAAVGTTRIFNTSTLKHKESNRQKSLCTAFSALGADIKAEGDCIVINGTGSLKGGEVNPSGDHRVAMAASLASSICDELINISDSGCVSKSYPGFFHDLTVLGGAVCDNLL